MPRLIKPLSEQPNLQNFGVTLAYKPETLGFELNCPSMLFEEFRNLYGRYMMMNSWWISEIYWKPLKLLVEQYGNQPCMLQGIQEFESYIKRLDRLEGCLPDTTTTGTKLRRYQMQAVQRLLAGDLLLGDTMGAGKTLSALWAWSLMGNHRLVVITPNDDVSGEWKDAVAQHLGRDDVLLLTRRSQINYETPHKIICVPYSRFWREDFDGFVESLMGPRTVLVLDEAHRASSTTSEQHKMAYTLALKAGRVWLLTGTEVRDPNQYFGLYKIVRRQEPQKPYGKPRTGYSDWVDFYQSQNGKGWDSNRLEQLNHLRKGFAISRTKGEICKELPPLTWINKPVPMHPIQASLYKQMEKEKECEVLTQYGNAELSETNFLVVYLRLMQLASHPILIDETRVQDTPKIDALLEIVEGMGRQKAIIWSNWPKTIDYLQQKITLAFPWLNVAKAHGGVSKDLRNEAKSGLKAGTVDIIVANPCVWGEGVNLQAASVMVYWDYHPSSVRWEQSNNRLHRLGQTLPVTAYKIYHPGSIETRILAWLEQKKRLATIITSKR